MTNKPRSREQIVRSLLKPAKPQPSAAALARTSTRRRLHAFGQPAREQVGANAARTYQRSTLHPLAQPFPIAAATGIAAAAALFFTGSEVFLIAVAVPMACLVAFGAVNAAVGGLARGKAKEEIELAAAFDRLVESAASELPESALERLTRMKGILVRLLPKLALLRKHSLVTGDEQFFVRQAVVRYVPDAIGPFLSVPPERRNQSAGAGESPVQLLNDQLDLVLRKLESILKVADEAGIDTLRRNRTFLDRKVG